ncbi:MAG: CBS domain-containing protein [Magnetospirillum sp.]|nr:CBS domain-containing protein [Magnetospirillum sp.]
MPGAQHLHVRDVMTSSVITVAPDSEAEEVARVLLESHITGVPVVDGEGTLLGMVSETDLERATGRPHAKAVDVMAGGVVTINEEAELEQAERLFDERRVRRAVVVRPDGRMRGIVTRSDLLRGLAREWDRAGLPPEPDMDAIRQRVLDVLGEYGGTASTVKVVVVEGVAHLWGVVESENERRAMHGAVAVVPGVLGVDNHLIVHSGTVT